MKSGNRAAVRDRGSTLGPPGEAWSEPALWEGEKEVNPLLVIHQIMQGRYLWAMALALLLGAGLAYAGYKIPQPIYRSAAMIRFRPVLPVILHPTEQNQMMPMYDSYVDSQVLLMRSQRVTDLAMETDEWKALHRGSSPEAVSEFVRSLDISRGAASEIVQIAFMDKDPSAAISGAKSVLETYQKIYGESDFGADAQRMEILEGRRTALGNEIKENNAQIQAIAAQFGSDALEETYQYKVSQMNKIETEWRNVQLQVNEDGSEPGATQPAHGAGTQPAGATVVAPAAMKKVVAHGPAAAPAVAAKDPAASQPATTQAAPLTEEQIAQQDAVMRTYVQQRRDEELKIRLMMLPINQGGQAKTAEHKDVKREQVVLDSINRDAAKYRAEYVPPRPVVVNPTLPEKIAPKEDLAAKEVRLHNFYDQFRTETLELGRKALQIKNLREQSDTTRHSLDETQARIDQLNVEAAGTGRIMVVSTGDRPGLPWKDQRRPFAIAGGAAGAALGMGIVMLIALANRRLRHSGDAHGQGFRAMEMLGVLPRLPAHALDVESAALAAHCVHGVRAALQVSAGSRRMAYAITSPSPGEGKTSLALALGMSFAASGSRTLMIDCDLIGGGLSSRVKGLAKTSLMTTLLAQRTLDIHQLKQGVKEAQRSVRPLDETLIGMGLLTREDVDLALQAHGDRDPGLMDVIKGAPLLASVKCVGERRLSVLALGGADGEDVPSLSPRKLRRLIETAKKHYDVILVDTGPVLGSLEAVMVGGQVDAVLMVVSRGTSREVAMRAVEKLEASGGHPQGVVFNRADAADATFASSSSQTSPVTSRNSGAVVVRRGAAASHRKYERMGPLVSAVAVSTAPEREENL